MRKPNLAIVKELKRIAKAHGGVLRPLVVVDAARPKRSILHGQFNWDDTSAAEQYRLWQARMLMRVSVSYVLDGAGNKYPCRVFVSLTPDREDDTGYRVTTTVLSDPDQRRQLLDDAKTEMRHFAAKYRHLVELAAVFAAMDEVE